MGKNLTLARVYISCLLVALLAVSGTGDQRKNDETSQRARRSNLQQVLQKLNLYLWDYR